MSDKDHSFTDFDMFKSMTELKSVYVDDEQKKMNRPKTAKETLSDTVTNIRNDSRRFYKFVKSHIRIKRGDRDTKVKEISIIPEEDGSTWAKRSVNSAASRSSIDSNLSSDSHCSKDSYDAIHDIDIEHYSSDVGSPS
ncbi:uncharacterized protein LOC134706437 isoform X1 [Mytilus trossulus]|uniref:uncharacterized protein LOC134706437 isoform X1 n=1 Tax=Mytilus trossulus TaxID=6551 RepID=UPI003006D431